MDLELALGSWTCRKQHKPLRQSDQQNLELHEIETAPSLTVFQKKKKIWFIFESDVCHLLIFPRSTNFMYEILYCIFLQRGQNARVGPTPLLHNG